jgi:hypothetical protein
MHKTLMFKSLMAIWACLSWVGLGAQGALRLQNPSFELDPPSAGLTPTGWRNLGGWEESPPDVQPGNFGVKMAASEGKYYVGLVVRDNDTWEGIGQRLEGYLKKDSAYAFSLDLARSPVYLSVSRRTQVEMNYKFATVLKIWGFNSSTGAEELLAESTPVSPSVWMRYRFELRPQTADFDEIHLVAYYAPGKEGMSGNLLLDNCSDIVRLR